MAEAARRPIGIRGLGEYSNEPPFVPGRRLPATIIDVEEDVSSQAPDILPPPEAMRRFAPPEASAGRVAYKNVEPAVPNDITVHKVSEHEQVDERRLEASSDDPHVLIVDTLRQPAERPVSFPDLTHLSNYQIVLPESDKPFTVTAPVEQPVISNDDPLDTGRLDFDDSEPQPYEPASGAIRLDSDAEVSTPPARTRRTVRDVLESSADTLGAATGSFVAGWNRGRQLGPITPKTLDLTQGVDDMSETVDENVGSEIALPEASISESKPTFWNKRDIAAVEPIHPDALVPSVRKAASTLFYGGLPSLFDGEGVALVLDEVVQEHAKGIYMASATPLQVSKVGAQERLLGGRLPNTLIKGRNDRMQALAEAAAHMGLERVIDMRISSEEATQRAFGVGLGVPVRPYILDDEPDGGPLKFGSTLPDISDGATTVYTVNGIKGGKAIEAQSPAGDPGKRLMARKNLTFGIDRISDTPEISTTDDADVDGSDTFGHTMSGRTYKTMFLIHDPAPDREGNHYLAGIEPLVVQAPGERARVISRVAAVALMPNAVFHVQRHFFSPDGQMGQKAEGIGSSVNTGGILEVDIPVQNEYLSRESVIGTRNDTYKPLWQDNAITTGGHDPLDDAVDGEIVHIVSE
jgi:hypothetical protein